MPKTRVHVYVSGKVQGVYFRQTTMDEAQNLGVCGWVKNLPDGRVEAVFQGGEAAVKALVNFCARGPKGASVTNVTTSWEPFKEEFDSFEIVY
jgi:acylphosphatase